MEEKKIIEKSMKICERVAKKVDNEEMKVSPLKIKKMVEEELDLGLSEEEITVLAVAFQHIDNIFTLKSDILQIENQMMFR